MLETMLNLSYAFIFVAGVAGLAVIATLGTTFITAGDVRTPIGERPRQARPRNDAGCGRPPLSR
jgi:hypothetical protein